MHSSRIRTVRNSSHLGGMSAPGEGGAWSGGCLLWEGCLVQGGGNLLLEGCLLPGGCLVWGVPGPGGGFPACTEQTPPTCGQNDRHV